MRRHLSALLAVVMLALGFASTQVHAGDFHDWGVRKEWHDANGEVDSRDPWEVVKPGPSRGRMPGAVPVPFPELLWQRGLRTAPEAHLENLAFRKTSSSSSTPGGAHGAGTSYTSTPPAVPTSRSRARRAKIAFACSRLPASGRREAGVPPPYPGVTTR